MCLRFHESRRDCQCQEDRVSFDKIGKWFALDTHQVCETLHVPRIVDPGIAVKVSVWWFHDSIGEEVSTTVWIVFGEWKCHCSVTYEGIIGGWKPPCQVLEVKIASSPVSLLVEPLTALFVKHVIPYMLCRCLPVGWLVDIASGTINESMNRLLTPSVPKDQFNVLTTDFCIKLSINTMIVNVINLGLMIIHVDLFTNRTFVSTQLLCFEMHVENITQHHCIMFNFVSSQSGVVHDQRVNALETRTSSDLEYFS